MSAQTPFLVFSGTNSRYLAEKICKSLGCPLGQMNIQHFADGEFSVIHALGVLPSHHGRGFARELVAAAKEIARSRGHRALRLDVLNGNIPAVRLYESEGFRFVSRVKLFYEDTGLTDFLLYEYAL